MFENIYLKIFSLDDLSLNPKFNKSKKCQFCMIYNIATYLTFGSHKSSYNI